MINDDAALNLRIKVKSAGKKAAKQARKLQKKLAKQLLKKSKKKSKNITAVSNPLYCAICDVTANTQAQLISHKNGKKHKAAFLAFKQTGSLAPKQTTKQWSVPSNLKKVHLDPAKKAARAQRFAAEYVQKKVIGDGDTSHRRIKAWGGDKVEHNAEWAIAKLLERKRKAIMADAEAKGLDPHAELAKVKHLVDPKILHSALHASSRKRPTSTKTSTDADRKHSAATAKRIKFPSNSSPTDEKAAHIFKRKNGKWVA